MKYEKYSRAKFPDFVYALRAEKVYILIFPLKWYFNFFSAQYKRIQNLEKAIIFRTLQHFATKLVVLLIFRCPFKLL